MIVMLSKLRLVRKVGFLKWDRVVIEFDQPFRTKLPIPVVPEGWKITSVDICRPYDAIPDRINKEPLP